MCKIFISHKKEDKIAAQEITNLLRTFGKNQLDIFISDEIPCGENWRKVISDQLSKANLLILLFTEPRLSWDWCLYETGLFMNLEGDDRRKVICIHTPLYDPPDPIRHLQAIPANQIDIREKFLKVLFGKTTWTGTPDSINPLFAKNEGLLDETAKSICSFFTPKETDSIFINRYFILSIDTPDRVIKEGIPRDATIRSRFLSDVFRTPGDECNWSVIVEHENDPRWLNQLQNAIIVLLQEKIIPQQIQATFLSSKKETIRPVLYRVDKLSSGAMEFYVLLVNDVSSKGETYPSELRTLATILRSGTRFRYEVLEKYWPQIRRSNDANKLSTILNEIQASVSTIETEAKSRMTDINENKLMALYNTQKDKDKIVKIFDDWFKTRQELFSLDTSPDKNELQKILDKMRQINTSFMCLTSHRYNDFINETMGCSKDTHH